MLKCPRCGTVYSSELVYEHIVGKPSTYSREGQMPRRLGISGRLRRIAALRRGITWEGLGSNSKTNAERGADKDMANYVERLTKALMETGDFSEDEAKELAEAFVRHYRALRYGDGLPKVDTVIEVLDSITSGKSNMEGGRYNMAIASALRSAFASTGVYKPLIRRALRLLRVEPSDDLVELGVGYFEELYEHLREEVGGVEPWRYATSIAIAAAALAKVEKLGAPPSFVKVELRIRGLENIYEELKLGKFINITEWNSENKETKL
jgi:polyhydroxyalkanoate synthesis regulator phasin